LITEKKKKKKKIKIPKKKKKIETHNKKMEKKYFFKPIIQMKIDKKKKINYKKIK
jgi:hypothetical protein